MARSTTKKTAAKKTSSRRSTDETCVYCSREAVARLSAKGSAVCETHKNRALAAGHDTEAL